MYTKDLTEDFRLRLSKSDMDFLKQLSNDRCVTVSEVVRSIISEYRRSLETVETLNKALNLLREDGILNGYSKTDIDDQL